MSTFERYLSVWVGLFIVLGVTLGSIFPELFKTLSEFQFAQVNIVVAVLIWLMIYPMMIQVDFGAIKNIRKNPKGLVVTLVVNWLVKPFTMAALGILFFDYLFSNWVSPQLAIQYIAGMILLGVAPCTAMVFVWSHLVKGDATYTLVQVALNDLILLFAFAPLAGFLLGVSRIAVPWETLLFSVGLYVFIPLVAGYATRRLANSQGAVESIVVKLKPLSIFGLLATVTILFGFQAPTILSKPFLILLIAIPLLVQSYGIFAIAYLWAWKWKLPFSVAAPAALIGTSNFFELAVAVAIGLFGLDSGASLATVVGVLVEVPVMLSLVRLANKTRRLFEAASKHVIVGSVAK
ncbi:MAG: ACR3 family arsenite efflux transporter [Bdellovibrionota bacterium]